jgi:hypothetical protein
MVSICGLIIAVSVYRAHASSENTHLEWKTGQWYKRLGDPREGTDGLVYAPAAVVEYASRILSGDPSSWNVFHEADWIAFRNEKIDQHSSDVVTIHDRTGQALVFWIQSDRWIRLNVPEGLDAINSVLEDNIDPIASPVNFPWPEYIERFSDLYLNGPVRAVLSLNFLKTFDEQHELPALLGTVRDTKVLKELCADPTVVMQGRPKVVCNMITSKGSVEQWTIFFELGKSVRICKVNIEQIYPEGSFTYSRVD